MASGLGVAYLNAACVTDAAIADIEQARSWYRARQAAWGALVQSGTPFREGRKLMTERLMATPASTFSAVPVPRGLFLRKADSADIEAVATIDAGAFGSDIASSRAWMAPLCCSGESELAIGELNGKPVATGYTLRCEGDVGPSVYLGGIAVLPSARRRGVAAALSAWLLARGFEEGVSFAHLQTDFDEAARVYSRLGFEDCDAIDIYADC